MKRAGILVLAGALVATLVAASDPMRERDADFRSQAISGTLHYVVYLPPGYGTSGMRYPVVYFLHGVRVNKRLRLIVRVDEKQEIEEPTLL